MSQYFSFQWHITDECDQRCKHCYIFSGEGCKELKSMTWNQMTEVVENCEDFCKVLYYLRRSYPSSGLLEINGITEIEKDTFYFNGKSISFERRNLQNVKGLWL